MRFLSTSGLAFGLALAAGAVAGAPAAQGDGDIATGSSAAVAHFDPQGKPPSTFTLEIRDRLNAELPFSDKRDFDEAKKGFIAEPPYMQIMADAGHVAWDMASYQWLLSGQDFATIHPSLQRQAVLNMAYGLYEVVPDRIYQVRGFDLANISFIKGDTGWIIFDPLTAAQTARAALEFINERLGERQGHADRALGLHGPRDLRERVRRHRDVAPHTVAVRHAAGAPSPRARRPGDRQERRQRRRRPDRSQSPDQREHRGNHARRREDGVSGRVRYRGAGRGEHVLPPVQGAVVVRGRHGHDPQHLHHPGCRGALNWSKVINEALFKFGGEAEVMFASHSWPRWGNERIQEMLRTQRDAYANLNNQTLHYVNQGVTINEIHNVYEVPQSLQQSWAARSYHGDVQNNVRGVVNRFIGHFDGNPVNLIPLSPKDSAPLYVEMMGGSTKIMAKGKELIRQGKYLHASEILNKLVFAEPRNQPARDLLADAYEQLGYQAESTSTRNTFLQGAFELRNGLPGGSAPRTMTPDIVRAMSTEQWLDFLGISMDPKKAAGLTYKINLVTPDNGEQYAIEIENATLTNTRGFQAPKPDLTITINRADLSRIMMGVASFDQLADEGKARFDGDRTIIRKLRDLMVTFTPDFEILPGMAPTERQVPPGRSFALPPIGVVQGD